MTDPAYYLESTRLSDMAQTLSRGEMPLDKDRSIIAQSAGKDAAELVKAIFVPGDANPEDVFQVYNDLKTSIFNSTLALAAAESVVERFEGDEPAPARTSRPSSGGARRSGGGGGDAATLEVRSGKYAGRTLGDIYEEDPDYVEWLAEKSNNTFLKNKAREFLAA